MQPMNENPYGRPPYPPGGGQPPYPPGWYPPPGPVRQPEDTTRPLVVLGGRRPTEEELKQLQALVDRRGLAVKILYPILMAVLVLIVFCGYYNPEYGIENLLLLLAVLLLFGIGYGLLLWGRSRAARISIREIEGRDGDRAVEIYADRIVQISAMRRSILAFAQIRKAVETPAFFVFFSEEGRYILLRAQDLTPFDAQKVRETVFCRLPAERVETRGWLLAALAKPLPIPVFAWEPPAVTVRADKALYRWRQMLRLLPRYLPLYYSFSLAAGVWMANSFWITPNYILDSFLFSLMVLAFFLVLYGILSPVAVALSKDRLSALGTLPLFFGVSGSVVTAGGRWHVKVFDRSQLLVKETRRGWEFRLRGLDGRPKGGEWAASVSRHALPDPSVMAAFTAPPEGPEDGRFNPGPDNGEPQGVRPPDGQG